MAKSKSPLPIGKKNNKLTILEEVPTNEKCRRYVYCKCDCGSKKVIRYDSFNNGSIKSCGCLVSIKKESQIEKMLITRKINKEKVIRKNYIGKKFYKLTIESIYDHPKDKGTWFNVKCDCGNILKTSLSRLKRNHTKSCGCIRRKYNELIYISPIDGEKIYLSGENSKEYKRTLISNLTSSHKHLHVYEAQKVFKILNKDWLSSFVVHHIDGNKLNNHPSNLVVLNNNSTHQKHHTKMEIAMYSFLISNKLMDKFYEQFPNLRLISIEEMLKS